jgi:hypothetical protein
METILCEECGVPRFKFTGIFNDYDARAWRVIDVPLPGDWTNFDAVVANIPPTLDEMKIGHRYWCPECKHLAPVYARVI